MSGLMLTSCEKWLEGQVVDFDLPDHVSVLSVYNYLKAGDSRIDVRVGESVSILQNGEPQPVAEINVKLYKNGQLQDEFSPTPKYIVDTLWWYVDNQDTIYYIDSTFTYLSDLSEPIQELTEYTLEVSAPGYETVTSTQMVFGKPMVTATIERDTDVVGANINWGYTGKGDKIKLTINDPAGESNYYQIKLVGIYEFDGNEFRNREYLNKTDETFLYDYSGNMVNDVFFDGTQKTFELEKWYTEWNDEIPERYEIQVSAMSKSYYDFYNSLSKYWNANGNPFAEPVIVYSNIENGLGLFATFNPVVIVLE